MFLLPGGLAGSRAAARRVAANASSFPRIDLIVTDVDGTLLNSQQQLSPRVEEAIRLAAAHGVPLMVATGELGRLHGTSGSKHTSTVTPAAPAGKARGPWIHEVLPRLQLDTPGVFLQGLLVYSHDGRLLHGRSMEADVALDAIRFAREHGLTLTAYCGERILCESTDRHTDRLLFYKEPAPEAVGPLEAIVGQVDIQKLIFMADHERIEQTRPAAEAVFAGRASLTTALRGMLEVRVPLSGRTLPPCLPLMQQHSRPSHRCCRWAPARGPGSSGCCANCCVWILPTCWRWGTERTTSRCCSWPGSGSPWGMPAAGSSRWPT